MRLEYFVLGMYQTNCYIIFDEEQKEALVIDPGDRANTVSQFLVKHSLQLKAIVLTHYHFDHVGAVEQLKKKYECPIMIHKKDLDGLMDLANQSLRLYNRQVEIEVERLLHDGDTITAGDVTLKVIHTPGHTPGSICLEVVDQQMVFTGDTIFSDSIGRTDLKGGNELAIRRSLSERVDKWADEVTIFPGHGSPATMAQVRTHNRLFRSIVGK